jgi:hypothetical protein
LGIGDWGLAARQHDESRAALKPVDVEIAVERDDLRQPVALGHTNERGRPYRRKRLANAFERLDTAIVLGVVAIEERDIPNPEPLIPVVRARRRRSASTA